MTHLARYFKQQATYWAPQGSTDTFGKAALAAPTTISVRWERKQEQAIDAKGREIVSKAIVFCDDSLDIQFDGFLYEGVSSVADPTNLDGAYQVRNVERVPSVRTLTALKMVML